MMSAQYGRINFINTIDSPTIARSNEAAHEMARVLSINDRGQTYGARNTNGAVTKYLNGRIIG